MRKETISKTLLPILGHLKTAGGAIAAASVMMACTANDSTDRSAPQDSESSSIERLPEDEIVYFMLPDRFANGDKSNDTGGIDGGPLDHGFDPYHKGFYHGGDLTGLTAKLDYIHNMGATAIWLGPIYKNKPVQGKEPWISAGYHGYWITDFTTVDPHLGTEAELKTFIESAHARGMKVYLDIITNHTADVIAMRECHDPNYTGPDKVEGPCIYRERADYPYTTRGGPSGEPINVGFLGSDDQFQTQANYAKLTRADYAYTPYVSEAEKNVKVPAWLNDPIYYHNRGESHWKGQSAIQGDFVGLDDLMTEHPVVVDGMIDIFKDWITKYRIDGFRVDTAKHVNPNFWKQFVPAMQAHAKAEGIENFYIFGEAYYDNEPEMLAWHTKEGGYNQVLDFAAADTIRSYSSSKEPAIFFEKLFYMDDMYDGGPATARRNPTFTGNHDKGRISGMIKEDNPGITQDELLHRTRLAHQLMFFLRGVPVIYAGDEQGFVSDSNDQLAREDMFSSVTEVYNDNDLIGTDATTAEENYDQNHPLYLAIKEAANIRKNHPAFRRGALIPRLMEEEDQGFAFSRIDPENSHEYIVIFNGGPSGRRLNVAVDPFSKSFTSVLGECAKNAATTGVIQQNLSPFEVVICRSEQPSSYKR